MTPKTSPAPITIAHAIQPSWMLNSMVLPPSGRLERPSFPGSPASAGDHNRCIGVGGDMLRHAAPQDAARETEATGADHDRVVAALVGDLLDGLGRIAVGLDEVSL